MQIMIISTTVSSEDEAKSLAKALLTAKLAACIKIIPSQSMYVWNNEIQTSNEFMLVIKTLESARDEVYRLIKDSSSYDLPEFITVHGTASPQYFSWINECLN